MTALIGRARALQALGHHEDALAATEEALRITPNNGTAMLLRALHGRLYGEAPVS